MPGASEKRPSLLFLSLYKKAMALDINKIREGYRGDRVQGGMVLGGKLITISRLLPNDEIRKDCKSGNILKQMRSLVREAKIQESALAESKLYDIGIIRSRNGWEIKMYFFV